MAGGGGNSSQTTKVEFADEQKPYINKIFSLADQGFDAAHNAQLNLPNNRFLPETNPLTFLSLSSAADAASNFQNLGAGARANADYFSSGVNSGKYLDPANMIFDAGDITGERNAAIEAAINPIQRRLTEEILPTLRSSVIDQGAVGGSKSTELTARALRDFDAEAQDVGSRLAFEDVQRLRELSFQDLQNRRNLYPQLFNAEKEAALASSQLAESSVPLDLAYSNALGEVGAGYEALQQREIDQALAQFDFAKQLPFQGLDTFASFIQGFDPQNSTTTASKGRGGISGAISGGLGGAALASALGLSTGGVGLPVIAALGALGGGLF